MSEFMSITFFGVIFCFAIVVMVEGFAFLNRVLLVIWFDFDYVEKNREWVRNAQESIHRVLNRLSKKKTEKEEQLEKDIIEASKLLIIEGEEDDIYKQK